MKEGLTNVFVYGPYTNADFRQKLFGEKVEATPAVIGGHVLGIQTIDQVPDLPRGIVKAYWGEGFPFKAYTLRKQQGLVWGSIVNLNERQMSIFKIYDLQDEGWYCLDRVNVYTPSGALVEVITDMVSSDQPIQRVSRRRVYSPFLNGQEKTLASAADLYEKISSGQIKI